MDIETLRERCDSDSVFGMLYPICILADADIEKIIEQINAMATLLDVGRMDIALDVRRHLTLKLRAQAVAAAIAAE